jgi:hypothetical protein
MEELLRCRAMESMCRQRAVFDPLRSWKYLAEAEMWKHKALDQTAFQSDQSNSQQSMVPGMANRAVRSHGSQLSPR